MSKRRKSEDEKNDKFVVGNKPTGEIDLEVWYNHYKKFWTAEERKEYEEEVLNEWKTRHGRFIQENLL